MGQTITKIDGSTNILVTRFWSSKHYGEKLGYTGVINLVGEKKHFHFHSAGELLQLTEQLLKQAEDKR